MRGIGNLCLQRISKRSSRNPRSVAINNDSKEDKYTDSYIAISKPTASMTNVRCLPHDAMMPHPGGPPEVSPSSAGWLWSWRMGTG